MADKKMKINLRPRHANVTKMKRIIKNIFSKNNKERKKGNDVDNFDGFFRHDDFIEKINFKKVVKRVIKNRKTFLTPYPLGFKDISWLVENNENEFKKILFNKYYPNEKIVYDMPKKYFTFRPVSYLQPIDSVVYQALVDRMIKHKRNKFSKSVYSHIINPINRNDVFHNPVGHWLDMRKNLRARYKKGLNYYLFSDISGYFENIKIGKLFEIFKFYVGREDSSYLSYLKELLCKWQYASAQGLIQPHSASSILAKVYLTSIDSVLGYLKWDYSRYLDEFHILAKSKLGLYKITERLNEALRDLGLNINVAKSELLEKEKIMEKLDRNKDFFDSVSYLMQFESENEEAIEKVKERFSRLGTDLKDNNDQNLRIFRYCINKFKKKKMPDAISFCLDILDKYPDQTVECIKYLNIFVNDDSFKNIIQEIHKFIRDEDKNLYQWQQIWLLTLIHEVTDAKKISFDLIWDIVNDENQDDLSRSICYLILTKHLEDYDLIILREHYEKTTSLILRRTLLFCLSKLPRTYTKEIFKEEKDDDVNIIILKMFLQNVDFDISEHKILE